jgi:transposase InsO family protein
MEQEEIIRQEAVRMHLQGESVLTISTVINRTRQWVYKWIERYNRNPQGDWYKSASNAPKQSNRKIDNRVEKSVISIRKSLQNKPYAQKGALSIMYEFEHLGMKAPSLSTINRILQRNDLIQPSSEKTRKETEYPTCFLDVQQMDLVGPKYLKGGFRFYFYNIIDTQTHYAGVYPILDKSAESITPCTIDFWRRFQRPDFLQMDNELSFRGSNRHPRGLGLLMRVTLSNGVTPIFIPPAEPWRNGIIEKFNDTVLKYFYNTQTFSSYEELCEKAKDFATFHNKNHRYSSQSNQTPNQMIDKIIYKSKLNRDIDLKQKIIVEDGRLIFIRFIRSDLKLTVLNTVFILKQELKYSYVVCEIIVEKHMLVVSQKTTIHHVFEFAMPLS